MVFFQHKLAEIELEVRSWTCAGITHEMTGAGSKFQVLAEQQDTGLACCLLLFYCTWVLFVHMSTCTDIQAHKSSDEWSLPTFLYSYILITSLSMYIYIYIYYREGFTVINQDFMLHVTDLTRFHCSQVDWSMAASKWGRFSAEKEGLDEACSDKPHDPHWN